MKIDAFSFNAIQNAKTMGIIARREGITSLEAFIVRLDNMILERSIDLRKGKRLPAPGVPDENSKREKKENKEERSIINRMKKDGKEKLQNSYKCPECNNGRVVKVTREGVKIHTCTYPESKGGGLLKFETGCGWSKAVENDI